MKIILLCLLLPVSNIIAAEAKIIILPANLVTGNKPDNELEIFCSAQAEILRGLELAKRVSQKLKVSQAPVVNVNRMPRTSIIVVKVTGTGGSDKEYLDTLLNEFAKYKEEIRTASIEATEKKILEQLERVTEPKQREALTNRLSSLDVEISSEMVYRISEKDGNLILIEKDKT